ncbi:HD domain-containing protein, partial [Salmonella enterica]|uniref:HD domain-containing protein n=1 Tax=Salmonella enterica TaxID=28901 RepID=UPI0020C32F81
MGKSLAGEVLLLLGEKYASEPWVARMDAIPEIVAAACLAHDLGNPPFGHSGERTISAYFSEGKGQQLKPHFNEW